jgi:hypothetical protein
VIIPVWAASWELSCCQPEAKVGEEWAVPIDFVANADPWWVTDWGASATDEQRRLGLVTLTLTRVRSYDEGETRVAAGSLRFRMLDFPGGGRTSGRLRLDAHPTSEKISSDEVMLHGVVRRIDLVPLRYERGDNSYVPVAQLEAIDANSTLYRDAVDQWPVGDAPSHTITQPLVWVEVEPKDDDLEIVSTSA